MGVLVSFSCHHVTPILTSENPNFSSFKFHPKIRNINFNLHPHARTKRHHNSIVHGLASSSDPNNPQVGSDGEVDDLGVKAALSVLRFYKREISPLIPKSCRYVPTCSEYSMEAYKNYGFVKGTILTTWRICRCNPLGGSGFDPPRWFDETVPLEEDDEDVFF